MPILAQFTEGITEITVSGLYQWDYGQTIEIQYSSLTDSFEVHFANRRSATAHIRMGSTANRIIPIPDALLEQPYDIIAWVYCVGNNEARTTRIIHIPVTPRTKPESDPSIDTTEQSQFQQMMAQFNQTVEYWKDGVKEQNANVKVKFWYGTQAQYNALASHEDNTLYIISDDPTIENLTTNMNALLNGTSSAPYIKRPSGWTTGISNTILTIGHGLFEFILPGGFTPHVYWDGTQSAEAVYNSVISDEYNATTQAYFTAYKEWRICITKSGQIKIETTVYNISNPTLSYETTTDTTSEIKFRVIE